MHTTSLRLAIIATLALVLQTRSDWAVNDAAVRFTYQLTGSPTHASAGYVVHIPDGGILPTPYPRTRVFSEQGTELKSYTLWQNAQSGVGIVFEAPKAGKTVQLYVSASERPNIWHPKTGLTPSAILCSDPSRGDMATAKQLGQFGPAGARVHFRQNPGNRRAPFCISGDLAGHPRPCSFYVLAHVNVPAAGQTWFAPMTQMGQVETYVDGQRITPQARIDKWGGTGQYVELSKGLHRVEVYAAAGGTGDYGRRGIMWLTWAPANAGIGELGGPRPKDVAHAGTAKWASRVMRANEIVRSGGGHLKAVAAQDGRPVAVVTPKPTHIYWLGGQQPLIRYTLQAFTAGNPADTDYTWHFAGDAQQRGDNAQWLFHGMRDNRVALTAALGAKRTSATHTFFGHARLGTDLNHAADRKAYLDACLAMVRAAPKGSDPTAQWTDPHWHYLFEILRLGEGKLLLAELFSEHWVAISTHMAPQRLTRLQDLFIMIAPSIDARASADWIARFEQHARQNKASEREARLQIARAEVLMFENDEPDIARQILNVLARRQGDARNWARIRLGDLELMQGKLNEATALYGDVQNRFGEITAAEKRLTLQARLERSRAAVGRQDSDALSRLRRIAAQPRPDERIDTWKRQAILEVAASETVRTYIEQRAFDEAYDVLRLWERQFPMTKISGDLTIQQARFHMALGQHVRARKMLTAYCDQVDASSYLADALGGLLDCMIEMNDPREDVRKFCAEAEERLEFHPAAERFSRLAK